MFGNINSEPLQQALGPVGTCAAPRAACRSTSSAARDRSRRPCWTTSRSTRDESEQGTWDFSANMSGDLFELPGGPLGLAMGLEYRDQKGASTRSGRRRGLQARHSGAADQRPYNVKEAYAELNAPLLRDGPFADLLELSGAVRLSDYSTSGSTTTFKAGVNWKPIPDLRLRASWAEGFRAPSIGELFGTASRFDQQLGDPCSIAAIGCIGRTQCAPTVLQTACRPTAVMCKSTRNFRDTAAATRTYSQKLQKAGWSAACSAHRRFHASPSRPTITTSRSRVRSRPSTPRSRSADCVSTTIRRPAPPSTVRVRRPARSSKGLLQNIAGIRDKGLRRQRNLSNAGDAGGRLASTGPTHSSKTMTLIVPITGGTTEIEREGTEQGSSAQAFPKWKSIGILDWDGTIGSHADWSLHFQGQGNAGPTTRWERASTPTCRRA